MTEILLKASQIAENLAVSRAYVYKLMRLGRIPSIRIGRSIRVRPTDLESFVLKNVINEAETSDFTLPHLAEHQRFSNQQ